MHIKTHFTVKTSVLVSATFDLVISSQSGNHSPGLGSNPCVKCPRSEGRSMLQRGFELTCSHVLALGLGHVNSAEPEKRIMIVLQKVGCRVASVMKYILVYGTGSISVCGQ